MNTFNSVSKKPGGKHLSHYSYRSHYSQTALIVPRLSKNEQILPL